MVKNFSEMEKDILEKITPTSNERKTLNSIVQELTHLIQQKIREKNFPITTKLVGSIAKDTYLRTALDIDLFLLFPLTYSKQDLGSIAISIGEEILKNTEKCYAEHPYIRGNYQGFKTEIVPSYRIESSSQKLSAVDRTPLHTKYIQQELSESQKNDIRLFKQFLRGIGCYGAEAEVEGFSGYLCEILILKYNTFHNLVRSAQDWRVGTILSLSSDPGSVFATPLVFIDPVDAERNVASALSQEKFSFFVHACKAYVKKPGTTFFFPNPIQPWSLSQIKEKLRSKTIVGIQFSKPNIISENLYPQLRKATRSIQELCEQNDFTVYNTSFHLSPTNITIILDIKSERLSKTTKHLGPPITMKKNTEEFIQKWTNHPRAVAPPQVKNDRLFVTIIRKYSDIQPLLQENLSALSMGKHLDAIIKKKYFILTKEELIQENLRLFWTENLDKKMPWER